MAMRETKKSLAVYFILVGVVVCFSALRQFNTPLTFLEALYYVVNVLIGIVYVYFGVTLGKYLVANPKIIQTFLLASAGFSLAGYAVAFAYLVSQLGVAAVPFSVYAYAAGTVLITWYLLANVRRLAAEAAA